MGSSVAPQAPPGARIGAMWPGCQPADASTDRDVLLRFPLARGCRGSGGFGSALGPAVEPLVYGSTGPSHGVTASDGVPGCNHLMVVWV